jgi:folate-binding protein YgfZ
MVASSFSSPSVRIALGVAQCIELGGADARAFAQAQFSGDVRALQPLHWQWNAWLDHRGGVRALMHLADAGDGRLLALLRGGDANAVCAELRKYVLRAKVGIEPLHDRFLSLGPALPLHQLRTERNAFGFGHGEYSLWIETAQCASDEERERGFRLHQIRNGWPRLPAGGEGEFLPPALGLEHLGAVSFDKGCYPGQEIAARLHYRGGHKRRLAHVSGSSALRTGEPLQCDARGVVLDSVETHGEWHALVVMDQTVADESSALQDKLRVIRRFGA